MPADSPFIPLDVGGLLHGVGGRKGHMVVTGIHNCWIEGTLGHPSKGTSCKHARCGMFQLQSRRSLCFRTQPVDASSVPLSGRCCSRSRCCPHVPSWNRMPFVTLQRREHNSFATSGLGPKKKTTDLQTHDTESKGHAVRRRRCHRELNRCDARSAALSKHRSAVRRSCSPGNRAAAIGATVPSPLPRNPAPP